MSSSVRNQILGIRATADFVKRFDELSSRLGFNRSETARYALKKFLNETWNSSENFQKARKEMF